MPVFVDKRLRFMTPWIAAVMVSSCASTGSFKFNQLPVVRDLPYFKEAPPLHTFELPNGSNFFDDKYIGFPERGIEAYGRKDFTTALHEFYGSARAGDPKSAYYLGLMFARGEGVPRDSAQADYWFEQSASRGNSDAQRDFASMLWQGNYLALNRERALHWYEKAADNGNAEAQYFLARLYMSGCDDCGKNKLKPDQGLAFSWMQKSAQKGFAAAQHNLALMYQYGAGTKVDLPQANYWFKTATQVDEPNAEYDYSRFYLMASSGFYDQERALYWLKKAALAGHAQANQELAGLQKQVELSSQSMVLFGGPLAAQNRNELRRTLRGQGGVTLLEQNSSWYDSYDSREIWNLSDRLFVGYVMTTGKVAAIQYRLPAQDAPKSLADIRMLLSSRYGKPASNGEHVLADGIYNEWKVKDTRIVLSKGAEHALFLSYYVEPAYTQLITEQMRHEEVVAAGKPLLRVY